MKFQSPVFPQVPPSVNAGTGREATLGRFFSLFPSVSSIENLKNFKIPKINKGYSI